MIMRKDTKTTKVRKKMIEEMMGKIIRKKRKNLKK
ncbi:hypothetical protein EBI_26269 [Enterocytozoon bieneusi H348]|nr:hypothetical protein EBI_26223 [Enterocytozoon bieneusi H348]EED43120.1 hypothetical protein EBI_26269 [Enterocytozoon bieneusi H348]|eukprot:XP_002650936.1 hypothetical protein EBI_26269 [Enterocytozoon bieneusi H348]